MLGRSSGVPSIDQNGGGPQGKATKAAAEEKPGSGGRPGHGGSS